MSDAAPIDEWLLAGRYRVDAPIGSGGMGEVWRGYDQQLDRRIAIKLMHRPTPMPLPSGSPEAAALIEAAVLDRERFLREIRTTARLDHSGIPTVYDFGVEEASGRIYLVMQLLYGQTLAEAIPNSLQQPVSWSAAIGAQIAATLVDVHRVDVVHRDIKPSNVMLTTSGVIKLLDFGVAVLQGAAALPRLTQIGKTVGSPPYMSREQALGNLVGPPTDVYALGCVLYEMLTGRVPFEASPTRSYQDHHVNTPARSVRLLRGDVPDELDELILAMLAKQPGERPEAEAVYEALLPFVGAGVTGVPGERDPRRPFLRPLAPTPRSVRPRGPAPAKVDAVPLDVDEALAVLARMRELLDEGHLQQAVDLLEDAYARAGHQPELALEIGLDLALALYDGDEFTRAADLLDRLLPELVLRDGDDDAYVQYLRYAAGTSHAQIDSADDAVRYLTDYLAHADANDPLYRDAMYSRGIMLHASGHAAAGLADLDGVLPLLAAEYGPDSIHVRTLERRIEKLRSQP
ncbi:hypothetical protein Cme02nite_55610 [Catellatospora methionotrophica]|uniref:non-specific serine/threonine protein kinase n=1 Tax=Catellatospora methionotrophica TaxID=121620 RepID=A0A8J3LKD6_9ACTN|nr:protein kinase [Catellatospora methionotrophica]GIG17229.1 hypothetical protein Cme02nite_55610 [Catellatospora methionotrophica]